MHPDALLTTRLTQLRRQRPFARVLVLEHNQDDVIATIEWLRRTNLPAGEGNTSPVLVLTARVFVSRRRTLGPVDVVFIHNQHNVARTDRSPSYRTAMTKLREQRVPATFVHIEPEPMLGVTPAPDGWECGTPFTLRCAPMPLGLPDVYGEPCGHRNPMGLWFCQACGIFRGVNYGDVQ